MNKQLEEFARDTLKKDIALLPDSNHHLFKRMYAPNNMELDINEVIDNMPSDRLDWAMQQVERSVTKLKKE